MGTPGCGKQSVFEGLEGRVHFSGTPHGMPLQANVVDSSYGIVIPVQDYDRGGEGIAYHDTDPANTGTTNGAPIFRPRGGVDLSRHRSRLYMDTFDDTYTSNTHPGEWVDYTIDIQQTRKYRLKLTAYNATVVNATGGAMHVDLDGRDVTGLLREQAYGDFKLSSGVRMTRGRHVLRVFFDKPGPDGECSQLESIEVIPVPTYSTPDRTPRDASFGIGGSSTFFYPIGNGDPVAIGPGHQGKLLLYDRAGAVIARFQKNGLVDPTFTPGALATSHLSQPFDLVKTLSDGKILVVSRRHAAAASDFQLVLRRYNVDGTPDLTFGQNGAVVNVYAGDLSELQDIAIQPDGKIVVAGTLYGPDGDNVNLAAVWRFQPNGSKDYDFADYSVAEYAMAARPGFDIRSGTLLIQGDGRILFVGSIDPNYRSVDSFLRVRLYEDGSLDTSYPNGGVGPMTDYYHGDVADLLQPDGKLVVAVELADSKGGILLDRFNSDGSLDTSFGKSGRSVIRFDGATGGNFLEDFKRLDSGEFVVLVYENAAASGRDVLLRVSENGVVTSTHVEFVERTGGLGDVLIAPDGTLYGLSWEARYLYSTQGAVLVRFESHHPPK